VNFHTRYVPDVRLGFITNSAALQSIRLTAEKPEREDKLRVFLEPAEWDEELNGSKPVIQLNVSTKSYIGDTATSGSSAVERSNCPCMSCILYLTSTHQMCIVGTVVWSVFKSALDPDIIRRNLAATRERALFPLFLPSGVGEQDMEKFWHGLQFNPAAPVEVPFKAELFRVPPDSVQVLRRLSRNGRNYLERTTRQLEGRPKLVLGLPNDAQDVAQLVALAHGDAGGDPQPRGGRSDSGFIDSTAAVNPSTEPRILEDIHGRVDSDVAVANIVSESQGATEEGAVVPGTASSNNIGTGDQPSQTKGPTSRPQVTPFATPFPLETRAGDCDNFIPETTLTHLEEMLSKDQRRIVEDQDRPSARARSRLTRSVHHRPGAAEGSKSVQLIKDLKRCLRAAQDIDRPSGDPRGS
jgi:hypothetical protein